VSEKHINCVKSVSFIVACNGCCELLAGCKFNPIFTRS